METSRKIYLTSKDTRLNFLTFRGLTLGMLFLKGDFTENSLVQASVNLEFVVDI